MTDSVDYFKAQSRSSDWRETTTTSTSARKSRYSSSGKGTDKAGVRWSSHTKKETIAIGKHVYFKRKFIKYQFYWTSEAFTIIQLNTSDKFCFFGTVLGKTNKLFCLKLDLLMSLQNGVAICRSLLKSWFLGRRRTRILQEVRQRMK